MSPYEPELDPLLPTPPNHDSNMLLVIMAVVTLLVVLIIGIALVGTAPS